MKRKEREWARHCKEMQNALNENNWKRYGWYVDHNGEMSFNWMKYRAFSGGLIIKMED
jgi:hypothetical protein